MWERVRTSDGRQMEYSTGWMSMHAAGNVGATGHGDQQGAMAVFSIESRKKLAFAILMNSESYRSIWDLSGSISRLVT
jgi:hypothetical protein